MQIEQNNFYNNNSQELEQFLNVYKPLKAPYEDQNNKYIQSFSLNQTEQIQQFYEEYGFVVIKEVLTPQECEISKQEISLDLKNNGKGEINSNDLSTLKNVDNYCQKYGMIGFGMPVILPQAMKNRQNENIFRAYQAATKQDFFLVAFQRYGFMRPTLNNPEWKTVENWLHLDMNPLTGRTSSHGYKETNYHNKANVNNPLQWQNAFFQGIVAIDDCPEENGGFLIVPGFQKSIEAWTQLNKQLCIESSNPTFVQIPFDDLIQKDVQKIPMRAGSFIIWDGRMPHANFPNNSNSSRYVQYIKMNAVGPDIISNVECCYKDLNISTQEFLPSELGQKLFGMKPWF